MTTGLFLVTLKALREALLPCSEPVGLETLIKEKLSHWVKRYLALNLQRRRV